MLKVSVSCNLVNNSSLAKTIIKTTMYWNNKLNEILPEWPCFYPRQNKKHQNFCKHPLQKLSPRAHYSNIWCSLGSCYHSRILCACLSGLFWHHYWTLHQTRWHWAILLSLNISAKRDDLLSYDQWKYLFFETSNDQIISALTVSSLNMAVSSVCCLSFLLPLSVVVPSVGSLADANKVFCLLAAGSGGVFCLCFSPFIWDSICFIPCPASEKLFWKNEQNAAWGSFSAILIQARNLSSVNQTFWNLHLYFPKDRLISTTISDLPLNEKQVCLIHRWCKSNNNKLLTT